MRRLAALFRRSRRDARSQPVILAYHRVASPSIDPWELAVSADRFLAQMRVLRRTRRPMAMSTFMARLAAGDLPSDAVAVTFDDGYADNLRAAKPILANQGIPATLFLTTGSIGRPFEYWWDELARIILEQPHAVDCEPIVAGTPMRIRFAAPTPADGAMWKASDGARTERQSIYLEIWRRLRDRSAADCDATLENLRRVLGRPPLDVRDLPMTRAELADMLAGGLIELGAHTISHRPLTALDPAQCRQELRGCRLECEQLAGAAIAGFAYPHGEVNAAACAVVEECGFEWACSLRRRAVRTGDDRYALPRLHVPDCSGAELAQALARAAA